MDHSYSSQVMLKLLDEFSQQSPSVGDTLASWLMQKYGIAVRTAIAWPLYAGYVRLLERGSVRSIQRYKYNVVSPAKHTLFQLRYSELENASS